MPNFSSLIANCNNVNFNDIALELFQFQAKNCSILKEYIQQLGKDPNHIDSLEKLIYLPISFFKSHKVTSLETSSSFFFKSSGTGGTPSKHYISDLQVYENSFTRHFNHAFGDYKNYCHLALLPNYIEQGNSSLVYQVNHFVKNSPMQEGHFYLSNFDALALQLEKNKKNNIPTILWGVSYALLDFAAQYQCNFKDLTLIETGGMKGRKKEIIRAELHRTLQTAFPNSTISSEYGMTELLSQAYWDTNLKQFQTHPSLRVIVRDTQDPFNMLPINRHGAVNVIDLNNWQTCSFIETADLGITKKNFGFEVLGRLDQAETRGCSLLYTG